ncbi:MAG: hypothetical protein GY917_24690 [Planctomycetaceae bacterium]|nr:hypothetical protein [Planctomycetaceae bacterium]
MARFFRLWGKKRGDRRTGSSWAGEVGEAAFFVALLVLGILLLIQFWQGHSRDGSAGESILSLTFGVMCLLLVLGTVGLVYTIIQLRISTERRLALARQASQLPLRQQATNPADIYHQVPHDTDLTNSPGIRLAYRLPANESPVWQMSAAVTFFLLWVTITISLSVAILSRQSIDNPNWLLLFILVACTVVGCWSIFYLWRQLRRHAGIGPTSVEISDHPLHPGREYALFLSQAGHLQLESFRIALVCHESATYRQGTDTRTSIQPVYSQELLYREKIEVEAGIPFEQDCEFQVPMQVMHSFQGTHNAVQWKLRIDVQTREWPPFQRTFPVVLYPPPVRSREDS